LLNGLSVIPQFSLPNPADFVFGCVLAPWPNRLEDGAYQHEGKDFSFDQLDAQQNKNHGLLLSENFEIRAQTQSELVLGYRFGRHESYPFNIDLEISYQLLDHSLQVCATAKNTGPVAPFAIGFHPYVLTAESFKLSAGFSQIGLNDERMLPAGIEPIAGLELDQNSVELETLDNCFFGSDSVQVTAPNGSFEIRSLENLPYFMLYRPKQRFFESGGAIAIEPMSAPANVFRTDPGSVQLATGQTKQFRFEIRTL
jgi:aldose 1-epimerase